MGGAKKAARTHGDKLTGGKNKADAVMEKNPTWKKIVDKKKKTTGKGFEDPVTQASIDYMKNPKSFKQSWQDMERKYGGRDKHKGGGSDGKSSDLGSADKNKLPAYQGITDKAGNLGAAYKSLDTAPWLKMQLEKEDLQRGALIDQGNQKSLAATTGAMSNLASMGGLRSGSAERIAKAGVKNQALADQGVRLQSNINRLGLEDAGFDKAQAARQFDVQNAIQDKQLGRAGDLYQYGEKMKAWAANKQGDAIAKSGKK